MGGLVDQYDSYRDWCNEHGRDPDMYSYTYDFTADQIRNTLSDIRISSTLRRLTRAIEEENQKKAPVRFTQIWELYGTTFDKSISESVKTLEKHRLEYKIYISKIEHFYFNVSSNILRNILKLIHDDTLELIKNIEAYYAENSIYFSDSDSANLASLDLVRQSKTDLTKIIFEYVSSHLRYASHNNTKSIDKILSDCENIRNYLCETDSTSRTALLDEFKTNLRIDNYTLCASCGERYLKVLNYCFHCCERNE